MAKYEIRDGVGIIAEWETEIGSGAFSGCTSLTTVRVAKNTKIAEGSFEGSPNVKIERY